MTPRARAALDLVEVVVGERSHKLVRRAVGQIPGGITPDPARNDALVGPPLAHVAKTRSPPSLEAKNEAEKRMQGPTLSLTTFPCLTESRSCLGETTTVHDRRLCR